MALGSVISAGRVHAEPWAITPRLGVAAYYYSNPTFVSSGAASAENVAALADLPFTYDADALEILVDPSARVGNERGYYSLASNYAHLDASLQYSSDLGSTTLRGDIARDSSLYFVGGLSNGIGVRRDLKSTSADWTRSITERSQIQLDASWSEVRYDQSAQETGLTDYRYITAGPTLSYSLTERDTLQLTGSAGRYESLNGITESKTYSAQLGYVHQLDELWKLTASAGYSRSANSEKVYYSFFFYTFYLGTFTTSENAATYSLNLTREGERFRFATTVSRALQPTGFAFLSEQDSINLSTVYKQSDRLDYGFALGWQRARTPEFQSEVFNGQFLNPQIVVDWSLTERWTVSLQANRMAQQFWPPHRSAASNDVNLSIFRQFLRTDL